MTDICEDQQIDFSKSQSANVMAELSSAEFLIDLLINNNLYLDGKSTGDEKSLAEMEKREEKNAENLPMRSIDENSHAIGVAKEETKHCFRYGRDILLQIRQFPASQAKFQLHDWILAQSPPFTCLRVVPNTKKPDKATMAAIRNSRKKDKFIPPPPTKILQYREPVQLHKSENPWIPVIIMHMKKVGFKGHTNILSSNPNDQFKQISLWKKKKAVAILNKITSETFEKFCTQLLKLELDSHKSTEVEIVDIIVKKTISEEKFCALYVKLLTIMTNKQQKPFIRKQVLDQFQIEFNRIVEEILKLQKVEREFSSRGGSKTALEYAQEFKLTTEKKMALKSDCLALMKAIGELYNNKFLTKSIIVKCICTLFGTMHDLGYESLCSFLTQVGQKLETEPNDKHFSNVFWGSLSDFTIESSSPSVSTFLNTIVNRLKQVANENIEISWSTLCAILNVIDLRNNGWKKTVIPETPVVVTTNFKTPLQEVNGIDGNWRRLPKTSQKNQIGDNYNSEPKGNKWIPRPHMKMDKKGNREGDIEGEIIYRRFRPNKSDNEVL